MQTGGAEKLGGMSRGILRAAMARRELRQEATTESVPESGIRSVSDSIRPAAMDTIEGNAESVH